MKHENGHTVVSPKEMHVSGRTKREMYGWKVSADEKGRFDWLEKNLLRIDDDYQRKNITQRRITKICKEWCWPAVGALVVFKRIGDGRYYVVDGQHRLLAALKRDDVQELPCLIFDGDALEQEASAFVAINTVRGPMKALEAFKARVVANDPIALTITAALEEWGYQVAGGNSRGRVSCIAALEKVYGLGDEPFRRVLSIVCSLADGDYFQSHIVTALGYLDYHMERKNCGNILRKDVSEKLLSLGMSQCEESMRRYELLVGKGGERIRAAGLLVEINKGKRTNKIPVILEL